MLKETRMVRWVFVCALMALAGGAGAQDVYRVRFGEDVLAGATDGRLRIFFVTEDGARWERADPLDGPFFSAPQPIASIALKDVEPGQTIDLFTRHMDSFPADLEALDGSVRLRAIFDWQQIERSSTDEAGNPASAVLEVELRDDADDVVEIVLDSVTVGIELPEETRTLRWVEYRSEMLSEFYGRDVYHRAGVILPEIVAQAIEDGSRVVFPAVYVVPGYGGRHTSASGFERRIARDANYPEAVTVVLDAESPLGHHGFVDSPNHGARGTALVEELVPELERRFKLDARPGARIVTGHSSGGWSSLWLQLHWPEVFGACWSSAPDPVSFGHFQRTDIFEDRSMYTEWGGVETPSMRRFDGEGNEIIAMTVRQENLMEFAMDPTGGSGQQWDAWEAMFSPRDEGLGMPMALFDAQTGRIDREVAEYWKRHDIVRLVAFNPMMLSTFAHRVRLACGTQDSFYLNRAVEFLDTAVRNRRDYGQGYVWLVEGATHGSVRREIGDRWSGEMREFLGQPMP
ncbi:MAG: alpha/beta hydrolase-fold protein [Planctomycetota bacterium]|jgi:hypothetical protein